MIQNTAVGNRLLSSYRRDLRFLYEIRGELIRKSLHLLIAFVPSMSSALGVPFTLTMLALGTLTYSTAEYLRTNGKNVFIISKITVLASRDRDIGRFVLGPITLAVGAMLALMLYPAPAAAIAVYALAFGDGLSSLFGKLFGETVLPYTGGKTFEGSLICFLAVFLISYHLLGSLQGAVLLAATATLLEALPVSDLDNIFIPMGVGLTASALILM